MPISFGSSGIGGVFYGSTPIKEVYSGGTLVWSSGPSWPQTGAWSGNTINSYVTVASFTIPETGTYNLEWAVTWGGAGDVGGLAYIQINNGSDIYGNVINTGPGTSLATSTSVTLAAGDVIKFITGSAFTSPATGEWTIAKT